MGLKLKVKYFDKEIEKSKKLIKETGLTSEVQQTCF